MQTFPVSNDLRNATMVHIDLLDEFIRLTESRLTMEDAAFARESLHDLLGALKTERTDYIGLLEREDEREAAPALF